MIRIYNKLVRDNIPNICKQNNQTLKYHVLDDNKYKTELKRKLKEETKEYISSGELEELADILEVVEALANANDSNFSELLKIKEEKAKKNGKFEKKFFLESVR